MACTEIRPAALYGRGGYVLTTIPGHLVISAPLANPYQRFEARETGHIIGYSFAQLQCGGNEVGPSWTLDGQQYRGRYGMAVAAINASNFAVGAPFSGYQAEGAVDIVRLQL